MLFERPWWWEEAACRGLGTPLFFGDDNIETVSSRRRRERAAKQVCATCPVTVECLADALKFADEGVRGGLTRYERQQAADPPTFGEWVLIANSAGRSGDVALERRAPDHVAGFPTFRVIKAGRVLKQTRDETEAWIALYNADL